MQTENATARPIGSPLAGPERRQKLANRRYVETFDLDFGAPEIGILSYTVTIGWYGDGPRKGELAEIFFEAGKSGTHLEIAAREQAISISFALQYGATIEDIRASFPRTAEGHPEGPVGTLLDMLALRTIAGNQASHTIE